jgi:hypothetical protein
MVSLLGAIVAALAIFVVASLRHEAWASVSQRRLLLWTIALGTVLALALRSIGRWPVNDFALVAWWAVFVGVLAYGLSLVVARSVVRT